MAIRFSTPATFYVYEDGKLIRIISPGIVEEVPIIRCENMKVMLEDQEILPDENGWYHIAIVRKPQIPPEEA